MGKPEPGGWLLHALSPAPVAQFNIATGCLLHQHQVQALSNSVTAARLGAKHPVVHGDA